jgi:hypothetical protein
MIGSGLQEAKTLKIHENPIRERWAGICHHGTARADIDVKTNRILDFQRAATSFNNATAKVQNALTVVWSIQPQAEVTAGPKVLKATGSRD